MTKIQKRDVLGILHRIACIWCGLVALYWLFMCVLSFLNVQQNVAKFEPLGVYRPIQYYLKENDCLEYVAFALWATAEFLIYIVLCRRTEQKGYTRSAILYFSAMLMIHVAAWMYLNALPIPRQPPYSDIEWDVAFFRKFINTTILPTVMYFILYLLRVRRIKSGVQPKSSDCT